MAVTIKQMAKELGLSPASISLALRGKPRMSPETIRRVQELAKKLDYVQSNIGRALQSRQSRLIGYLLPGVTRTFYNEILQGAGEETAAHGYGLLVGWVNPGDEHVEHQVNLMLEKDIDGLIISESNHLLDPYLPRFTRRNKPVIFCSSIAPKKYIEVITDNFYGGFLAVETLAEFGHRHVLGCTELPDRFKGNRAAARQVRAPPEPVSPDRRCRGNPDETPGHHCGSGIFGSSGAGYHLSTAAVGAPGTGGYFRHRIQRRTDGGASGISVDDHRTAAS